MAAFGSPAVEGHGKGRAKRGVGPPRRGKEVELDTSGQPTLAPIVHATLWYVKTFISECVFFISVQYPGGCVLTWRSQGAPRCALAFQAGLALQATAGLVDWALLRIFFRKLLRLLPIGYEVNCPVFVRQFSLVYQMDIYDAEITWEK
jgi:hypothetical protein